jgi:hypothetical protein
MTDRPHIYVYKKAMLALIMLAICFGSGLQSQPVIPPAKQQAHLKLRFLNIANGKPVERDSIYTNASGESYQLTKLKYYISNIRLDGFEAPESYYLVNAFEENTFSLEVPPGTYSTLDFLVGVDSIRNCSGAQTGALDPLNDMFWTWSSGYVMFKLEGSSPSSGADLQRIEHHIGGYKGEYKTMRMVHLPLPGTFTIQENTSRTIDITADLDQYWQGEHTIKISDLPVLTTAGTNAKNVADNFPAMFQSHPVKYYFPSQ